MNGVWELLVGKPQPETGSGYRALLACRGRVPAAVLINTINKCDHVQPSRDRPASLCSYTGKEEEMSPSCPDRLVQHGFSARRRAKPRENGPVTDVSSRHGAYDPPLPRQEAELTRRAPRDGVRWR